MYNWIDLHMHSCKSDDGEFMPEELMEQCHSKGMRIVAVADHNTVKGIAGGRDRANQLGMTFIPGIEIDCHYNGCNLHVLCYGIDEKQEFFAEVEEKVERQEQCASSKRVDRIREKDIFVDEIKINQIAIRGVITGEMIAEVALEDEQNDNHPLLEPYRKGGARSDNPYVNFYWDFCSQGKDAYIPLEFISVGELVSFIQATGGITVLAHPGIQVKYDEVLLKNILDVGIDGIEVYSSYHDAGMKNFFADQAVKYNLLQTVGSDFHGKTKPAIQFGQMQVENQELLASLFLNKLKLT